MHPELARCLDAHSREARLWCDSQGVIQWVDEHAEHKLGASVGMPLAALAAPGSEGTLARICQHAAHEDIGHYALHLRVDEDGVTSWCTAVPSSGGVALLIERPAPGVPAGPAEAGVAGRLPGCTVSESALAQLRRELAERDRDIVALRAELDEKATATMTSTEIKSRIVSSVNHELRTAIHSILGLSKLLLDEVDGPLAAEQKTQVGFIRKAAEDLSHLAGDLVDLAKLDTDAMELRVQRSSVAQLFGSLRGAPAPISPDPTRVALVFEQPAEPFELDTDINKLSQVLRNLIDNALRFTQQGEVRISAIARGDQVQLVVRDTGIGIAPEDHERIFEGLRRVAPRESGTGSSLGLPFARKLARLLGGDIAVASQAGEGATFTVTFPRIHADAAQVRALHARRRWMPPASAAVLLVAHDHGMSARFEPHLVPAGFSLISASTVQEARNLLARSRPAAIVLDIMIEGESSWRFLGQLESTPDTRDIPVLVLTGSHREVEALSRRKGELWFNPIARGSLAHTLESMTAPVAAPRVLLAASDDWVRYLVRQLLADTTFEVQVAPAEPLDSTTVAQLRPDVLLLDASSPPGCATVGLTVDATMDLTRNLLEHLAGADQTRNIPVALLAPHMPCSEERSRAPRQPEAWLSKATLSSELAVRLIEEALQAPARPPARISQSRSPHDG